VIWQHRKGTLALFLLVATLAIAAGSLRGASLAASPDAQPATLRAAFSSFPDYIDPQLSYTFEGWNAMHDVYLPLLTYRRAHGRAGSEIVPGLARDLPRVTDGGRTYTLFLRPGLRYSDGAPVRASDFEYAIKRLLKLRSGAFPFYLLIAGAERFRVTGKGGIDGIVTDNASGRIVIHLLEPRNYFADLLAVIWAAPVPPSTPMHDATLEPPPATGPYAITGTDFNGWSYARNPAWDSDNGPRMPEMPRGYMDRIEVQVIRSANAEVQGVLAGRLDWMQNPPPAWRFASLRRTYPDQMRVDALPSTYYFWMNTRRPPFNDLRVRRAVNYAVDPEALRRIYGGQLMPTHQILPPGIPGFRRFNLYPHDLGRARRMIRAARVADRQITVWTDDESPNQEAGEYFAAQLRAIGFQVRFKVLSADNYFTVIGNRRTPNLDAGWSDWFADFPNPDDFFRPLLLGSSILPSYNGNFARMSVPKLDRKALGLARRPIGPAAERAYASLDRSYMKLAPWVPYGTRTLATLVAGGIDPAQLVYDPMSGVTLTSFRFK
jgi:peptide/nickel transport system substrate-binding protein